MGIISYIAQMLNITAYKYGEASVMASLDYVRLIYAVLFGWLLFETLPDFWTWFGAMIIISASIYTIQRENQKKQKIVATAKSKAHD